MHATIRCHKLLPPRSSIASHRRHRQAGLSSTGRRPKPLPSHGILHLPPQRLSSSKQLRQEHHSIAWSYCLREDAQHSVARNFYLRKFTHVRHDQAVSESMAIRRPKSLFSPWISATFVERSFIINICEVTPTCATTRCLWIKPSGSIALHFASIVGAATQLVTACDSSHRYIPPTVTADTFRSGK